MGGKLLKPIGGGSKEHLALKEAGKIKAHISYCRYLWRSTTQSPSKELRELKQLWQSGPPKRGHCKPGHCKIQVEKTKERRMVRPEAAVFLAVPVSCVPV